jgi:hypothetical protein
VSVGRIDSQPLEPHGAGSDTVGSNVTFKQGFARVTALRSLAASPAFWLDLITLGMASVMPRGRPRAPARPDHAWH